MFSYRPFGPFLIFLWMCFSPAVKAQVVNIERQRIATDTTGWFGEANLSFAAAKTTREILSLFAGGLVEYKSKSNKDLWLFITEFSLITGDNEDFSNSGFGHLRYNRKLSEAFRWEAFAQIQYNGLTKIETRNLYGTGIRIKLTPYETAKFYLGVAYMYEYEKNNDPIEFHYDDRMSSYFSFTLLPEENVSFMSTTYMQPRLDLWSDYRLTNETTLHLAVTRKLKLDVTFKYNYDVAPPEGVPNSTYYFVNGLALEF